MHEGIPIDDAIKETHLDYLLRLALAYEAQLMAGEAERESHRAFSVEDESVFSRTHIETRERIASARRAKRRFQRRTALKQNIRKGIHIAACAVLLLGVITPFAVAHIDAIRVRVMRLLIDIQEDRTNISIQEDISASFDVPAEWKGQYYPSFIPDGYSLSLLPDDYNSVVYSNADGDEITFEEFEETDELVVDSEDSIVSYGQISGNIAFIVEKRNAKIIWCNGSRLFRVTAADLSTAQKVAEGVKIIAN